MSDLKRKSIFTMFPNYESKLGDWQTEKKEKEKTPTLITISYLSSTIDDKNINLKFFVTTPVLKNLSATIFVQEMNATNETTVPKTKVILASNQKVNITVSFLKDKEFDKYFWQDEFSYQATITCDGFSAVTEEFKLKFVKEKQENKENSKELATQADWDNAAKNLGINDTDLIRAIAQQESENIAFLISGNPKILFERHHFYKFYSNKYGKIKADQLSQADENIIKNDNGGYGSEKFFKKDGRFDNEGYYNYQFERLEKAIKIDYEIAIKSTSFGLFQILGEYCIYSKKSEKEFFQEIVKSEKFQIKAFVNFIKADKAKKGFSEALNNKKWRIVASIYNGKNWEIYNPEYAKNIEKYYIKKPWKKN